MKLERLLLVSLLLLCPIVSCKTTDLENDSDTTVQGGETIKSKEAEEEQNEEELHQYLIEEELKVQDIEPTVIYIDKPVYVPSKDYEEEKKLKGYDAVWDSQSKATITPENYKNGTFYYTYNENFVYEIYAQPLHLTDIILEDGEVVMGNLHLSEDESVWVGYFYGMSYSGIWQNQEQIEEARKAGKAVLDSAQPGDMIWDDWNGDGVITFAEGETCDRHEIGNPNPDIMLGVNLGLQWKGFDFAVSGAGAFGMQIMRSYRSFSDAPYQNYDTTILNRWYGEGTSNTQPRITSTGSENTNWVSSRYMEDADYFKIKNVTLGYDFKKLWKSCPLQQLRLYVQAQNLYTFTKYTGLDPEVGNSAGGNGWASGVDLGLYPPSRTYMVGASIKF